MKKYWGVLLLLVFLFVLASRLYFAFSVPYFSSDAAYFNIRQIENIRHAGFPLFDDSLSYGGNTFVFSPVFHYIVAFFSLFMPVSFAAKIFPNFFASLTVFFVYLIVKRATKSSGIGVLAGFISGFVPIFFAGMNDVSVYSFVIPLFFLLIYLFMRIRDRYFFYGYIFLLMFLSFAHPIIAVFCFGLVLFQILIITESLGHDRAELEIILFSVFFIVWAQFLVYKRLFLFHGLSVVWQNIPSSLLSEHFSSISAVEAIYMVGVIPLIYGAYVIFRYLFKEPRKDVYLFIGFALSAGLLLWLRLIEFRVGLMFFGLILVILFSYYFKLSVHYIGQTRASKFLPLFVCFVIVVFSLTSVLPSFALARAVVGKDVSPGQIGALLWIRENTPPGSGVVASVREGNLVAAVSGRKNVVDSYFFLHNDIGQRLDDVRRIFTSGLETEVVGLMEKYGADYIYFSPVAMREFKISFLPFVSSGRCFEKVYGNREVSVYRKLGSCKLKVVG